MTNGTHREIAEVARLRLAHDARCATAPDDAAVVALGRELRALDRRMTSAAENVLRKPSLTHRDVEALARVLRHFAEDSDDGITLDDRPIVETALARLIGHLCDGGVRSVRAGKA